jgi:hypothetical protein
VANQRPSLSLVGSEHGVPTLDDLIKLTIHLTGKRPTPAEIDQVRAILDTPDRVGDLVR